MNMAVFELVVYSGIFAILCWGGKKVLDMILEITANLTDCCNRLEEELKNQNLELLKVRSQILAVEYRQNKSHREPRHVRNDIRYENEVAEDGGNT